MPLILKFRFVHAYDRHWRVWRMGVRDDHGVIVFPVIAHDERPPPAVAVVGAAAVEEVAVEEDCVTGLELDVGVAQSFPGEFHSLHIGPSLVLDSDVLNSSHLVRAWNYLQRNEKTK